MNRYQTLAANTALISIGTFGSKVLVFLMMRFYTGCLTPTEYSTADLITQTANLLIPLVSLNIAEGVFRFAADHQSRRADALSAGVYTVLLGSAALILALPLLNALTGGGQLGTLLAAFIIAACAHALAAQFVRAEGHTALYAAQGLLNTALYIVFSVLFLAVLHWGVRGYLLSTVMADCLSTLFLICKEKLWRSFRPAPSRTLWPQMLAYCVPLIPAAIFWWIMGVSDRYMVRAYLGSEANGIYAVAYKIPTILSILAAVFMDAWQLSAIAESGDRRTQAHFYARVWEAFFSAVYLCAGGIIALSPLLIRLLAAEDYCDAWRYIPVLTLSMIAAAFSNFMGSVYVVTKKSKASLWTSLFGAAANIALDLILIPRIGVQGAAVATFLGCLLVFLARAVSARRLLPFALSGGKLALGAASLLAQTAFILLRPRGWLAVQGLSLVLLFALALWPMLTAARTIFQRKQGFSMILTAFHGFCMALADSVPGVSGGTIAFILGFYDRFLDSLHALFGKDNAARRTAFVYLLKLGIGWAVGMAACVLALSSLFEKNIYFMSSLFLGLTFVSVPYIAVEERTTLKDLRSAPFALLGAVVVAGLTLLRGSSSVLGAASFTVLSPLPLLYICLSGAVAITAMVLPGISGSSILLIAGVYLPAIQAIRSFLQLQFSVLPGLFALGFGVIVGVALSIYAIRTALHRYRSQMVWLILGLMLGSLYAIANGPASLSVPMPPLSIASFDAPAFLLGTAILIGLELLRKRIEMRDMERKEPVAHEL